MKPHPIELLINKADTAINQEDFDTLVNFYAEDAVLVIRPGMNAVGKPQIRKAFEAIAAHFEHSLDVQQVGMEILETGDTALVLAKTLVSAKEHPVVERKATYVFKKDANDAWVCAIDNSYGHDLLESTV
ncbi:MAG: SgcJ/EcaC family oxidoreductase [Leptolyngbya sp. SIO1E4]|nr:SgcJ/EcaC family oxidoreductase [Leptolyngbya sp. SIO1E4]